MKKWFFLLAFLSLTCFATTKENIDVKIKTLKTVFYYNEPILIQFTLTHNPSLEPQTLKISSYSFLNYFVEVYNLKKVSIKEKDDFFADRMMIKEKLDHSLNLESFFKTLEISQGQIMGQSMNLLDYYDLTPGTYILKGIFYPISSYYNCEKYQETDFIKIVVKDHPLREQERQEEEKNLLEELKNILTPQDSIKAFFESKMAKNWHKFFYVIDTRQLIKQFPVFDKAYQNTADEEKNLAVEDFKKFLQELNTDEQIIGFDILETTIRKTQAIAKVVVSSKFRDMIIKREYRFGLTLKDHWYIYGYSVIQK